MDIIKIVLKFKISLLVCFGIVFICYSCSKSDQTQQTAGQHTKDTVGKGERQRLHKILVDSLHAIILDMSDFYDLRMSKELFDTDADHWGYLHSNEAKLTKIMFENVKPTVYDGEHQKITQTNFDTSSVRVGNKFTNVKLRNGLWKNFENKIVVDTTNQEYVINLDTIYNLLTVDTTHMIFSVLKETPNDHIIINFSLEDGHNLNLNGYPYFSDSIVFFYKEASVYNEKSGSDLGYGRIKNKRIANGKVKKVPYKIIDLYKQNPNEYLMFGEYYPYKRDQSVFEMKIIFKD